MRMTLRLAPIALALAACLQPASAADLLEIYRLAHEGDPQLQASEANQRVSKEGVVQARSRLLPSINGTAGFTDTTGDSTSVTTVPNSDGTVSFGPVSGSSDTRDRDYRVQLRQTIYNHSNYTALKSSRALASKGEADYQTALDNLFIRVSTAYFAALTQKTNLDAAEAQEKAVNRQLEQAEQRFEVGLTAITDVHEARAQSDAARANRILSQNQLDDAYEALAVLTGKPVSQVEPLGADLPLDAPEPADQEAWVKLAWDQSPALASQRFAVQATEHDVETARAGHYPYLDLTASYSDTTVWGERRSNTFRFPATQTQEGNSIGVVLTVPIFSGFATQSGVRQSIARRDIATDNLDEQQREVTRQVRNAYRAVIAGQSEVKARQQALVSAQSALDATQAGFEVGTRTIVDVLLSQQQMFAAQREYAAARHNFVLSGLKLKQAAGTIELKDIEIVNGFLKADASTAANG